MLVAAKSFVRAVESHASHAARYCSSIPNSVGSDPEKRTNETALGKLPKLPAPQLEEISGSLVSKMSLLSPVADVAMEVADEKSSEMKSLFNGRLFVVSNGAFPYVIEAHAPESMFRAVTQPQEILDKIREDGFSTGIDRGAVPKPTTMIGLAHRTAGSFESFIAYSNGVPVIGGGTEYDPANPYVGVLEDPRRALPVAYGTSSQKSAPTGVYEIKSDEEFHSIDQVFKEGERAYAAYKASSDAGTLPETLSRELELGKWVHDNYGALIRERPDGTFSINKWVTEGEWVHIGRILRDKIISFTMIGPEPMDISEEPVSVRYDRNRAEMLIDEYGSNPPVVEFTRKERPDGSEVDLFRGA